jgi:hypothetical protein
MEEEERTKAQQTGILGVCFSCCKKLVPILIIATINVCIKFNTWLSLASTIRFLRFQKARLRLKTQVNLSYKHSHSVRYTSDIAMETKT